MTARDERFSATGDPEVDQVLETLAAQTARFEDLERAGALMRPLLDQTGSFGHDLLEGRP